MTFCSCPCSRQMLLSNDNCTGTCLHANIMLPTNSSLRGGSGTLKACRSGYTRIRPGNDEVCISAAKATDGSGTFDLDVSNETRWSATAYEIQFPGSLPSYLFQHCLADSNARPSARQPIYAIPCLLHVPHATL